MQDCAERTDGQLLEGFLADHDEAAFAALVRRHGPMVLGVCRRILGNDADSDDAFQATFLVLVRKAGSLRSRSILGDWLHGVARHVALKARASAMHRRAKEQVVARSDATTEETRNDWLPLLDEELARLPEKYRLPVILCELEGKTRQEASKQLGWPEGTVAGRLDRARAMLAKSLARRGLIVASGALAIVLSQNVATACVTQPLLVATVNAAKSVASGQAPAADVVSVKVGALTEGVLKTMFLSKLKTIVTVLLTVALVGGVAGLLGYRALAGGTGDQPKPESKEKVPTKSDADAIQGSWSTVAQEANGEKQEKDKLKKHTWIFDGEKLTIKEENNAREHSFKLDPGKNPKTIDIADKRGDGIGLGIYKLDGDTLTMALDKPQRDRPKEFTTKKESTHVVVVLKRDEP